MGYRGSTKKPEEYSTNPNTMRARARKAKLDPYTREVEQAKSSDVKAVNRAWNLAVKEQKYKNASSDERKEILQTIEKNVIQRRIRMGLDAASKIERFRKHSPSATTPKSSSASDLKQNNKDSSAQSLPMQPVGGLKHPHDSAALKPPHRSLPDPSDHRMPNNVPRAVFPDRHVPAQQQPVRGQPVPAAGLSDSAVIANLQATVQRQEFQIQALYQAYQHLSVDMTFVKNTVPDQNAKFASVQSQLRALHTLSAQAHDQNAQLDNVQSQLKDIYEHLAGVDDEFVYPASHMGQLLDGIEKAAVNASNVGTSMATGGPDQLSGHEVDDSMSEHSQSESDGHSHAEHGATYSTECSPDDASQSTPSRIKMDQVSETASDNDQVVE
ncbi:hypothetical protein LQW54_008510 [Pestalotiopsis sp. IQ-011]